MPIAAPLNRNIREQPVNSNRREFLGTALAGAAFLGSSYLPAAAQQETIKIGIHQGPRDGYRRRVRDAGRNEEPRHYRAQLIGRNADDAAHVTLCCSCAAA